MRPWIVSVCIICALSSGASAQLNINGVYTTTATVGWSAISVDSIQARVFHFVYPVYDCEPDTLFRQVLISTRQRGENNEEVYLNKGGFASISDVKDTLKWKNESAMFDMDLAGSNLLVSNETKTIRFNRDFGFDELRFPAKIIHTVPAHNLGLGYSRQGANTLLGLDLSTGETKWTATIPPREDWVDLKMYNDSVLLILAAGLHAVNLRTGLMWSVPFQTAVTNTGTLVYSRAKHTSVKELGTRIMTSGEDNLITQLASNILVNKEHIYVASKESLWAFSPDGKVHWKTDLSDYPISKMHLVQADTTILLVNFGMATHGRNFVVWGLPFMLDVSTGNGEITDQRKLGEIKNLVDFMISERGLSFGGKQNILEVSGQGKRDQQTEIPLNVNAYGQFAAFIDGDKYFTLKEGYYVPLNFIDDKLVYMLADNNKIYGLQGSNLVYEYHFSDLYRFSHLLGNRKVLEGLTETLLTNSNYELLATVKLATRHVTLGNKLYFIDNEQVKIVDLGKIK